MEKFVKTGKKLVIAALAVTMFVLPSNLSKENTDTVSTQAIWVIGGQ